MSEIQKILVPTDFSSDANAAFKSALELAKRLGAEVHTVHVMHYPTQVSAPGGDFVPSGLWVQVRDTAARKLEKTQNAVESAGVMGDSHLLEGATAISLTDLAERLGIDLIVMGTRGLSGLKHVVLGSVAERTLRMAPCPVLTIRDDAPKFEAGAIRTIVVPTDFSEPSHRAVEYARDLALKFGPAKIALVHAYRVPVELDAWAVQASPDYLQDLEARAAEELSSVLEGLQDAGITSEYVARHGAPDRVIVDFALEKGADLIVMGTHGLTGFSRFFLGSVAERVARTSTTPVLSVKAESE